MARGEPSTIEVFFQALGHKEVQAALRTIATDAKNTERSFEGIGKKPSQINFANDLRSQFQRALKDQAYLAREQLRLTRLGADNSLAAKQQGEVKALQNEYNNLGRVLRDLGRFGRILNPNEQKDVQRLKAEFDRLGERIREIKNIPPVEVDPSIAKIKDLQGQIKRLVVDEAYASKEISRLSKIGANSELFDKENEELLKLRASLATIGSQIRNIKREGGELLSPNDLVDVQRLQTEFNRLAERIRAVKNAPIDETASVTADLRSRIARAIKDQAYVNSEVSKLSKKGESSQLDDSDGVRLQALRDELASVGEEIRRVKQGGKNLLSSNELKDVERLKLAWQELAERIRQVKNAPIDETSAVQSEFRARLARALKDQAYINSQVTKLAKKGDAGELDDRDQTRLQGLRDELAAVGDEIRRIKQGGRNLLSEDELKDVERLKQAWQELAEKIRTVRNKEENPDEVLLNQLKAQFARAQKDQQYIKSEIEKLGKTAGVEKFNDDEAQHLDQLKAEFSQLQSVIESINARGIHVLSEDELKDVQRLLRLLEELRAKIDRVDEAQGKIGPSLRKFSGGSYFEALKTDLAGVGSVLKGGVTGGISFLSTGLKTAVGFAGSLLTSGFGIVPAFEYATGSIRNTFSTVRDLGFSLLTVGFAASGLYRAFQSIYDSNAKLESTVTALRAVNDEIDKSGKRPSFVADTNSLKAFGNGDKVGGLKTQGDQNPFGFIDSGAQKSAKSLQFLNKVAYQSGELVTDLSGQFLQLSASAEGTDVTGAQLQKVFEGITNANLVLGGTKDATNRAIVALSQMASKGQVYAEELKGQLAEAIPGSVGIAARAYGETVADFNRDVQNGLIDSTTFIGKFGDELEKEYGEKAKSLSNSSRVAFGRLTSAFENAKILTASGKLDLAISGIYANITKILNALGQSGAFSRFGDQLAASIDKIGKRIENAANGGYDFEGVLRDLGKAFDFIVDAGIGAFDLFVAIKREIQDLLGTLAAAGFRIPSLGKVFEYLAKTVNDFKYTLDTGIFTDNPFANLLSQLGVVASELAQILFSQLDGGAAFTGFGKVVQYAAYWLGQLGIALGDFHDNKRYEGLDGVGQKMLDNLNAGYAKIQALKKEFAGISGVFLGNAQANDTDGSATKKAYGYRGALSNLFTGQANVSSNNPNSVYNAQDLQFAFQVRDLLVGTFHFLIDNKDAIAGAFIGALNALEGISAALQSIVDVLNFFGINANIGYIAGMLFILGKLPGVSNLVSQSFANFGANLATTVAAQEGTFGKFTTGLKGLGSGILAFSAIAIAAAGTFELYKRFHNEAAGGGHLLLAGLTSGFGLFSNSVSRDQYSKFQDVDNLRRSADAFAAAGNPIYQKFRDQGLTPLDAAAATQKQVLASNDATTALRRLAKAANDVAPSTDQAFGGPDDTAVDPNAIAAQAQRAATDFQAANDDDNYNPQGDDRVYNLRGDGDNFNDQGDLGPYRDQPETDYERSQSRVPVQINIDGLGRYNFYGDPQTINDMDSDVSRARAGRDQAWAGNG